MQPVRDHQFGETLRGQEKEVTWIDLANETKNLMNTNLKAKKASILLRSFAVYIDFFLLRLHAAQQINTKEGH